MKMQNKKDKQAADRKKHKEQLKPKRRPEPNLDRKEGSLSTNPKILIVCEGKKTEPSYFNQFRVPTADVLPTATAKVVGEGYNTLSLVDRAKELCAEKKYDQVWCVFDKDDFSDNDFNNAITKAENEGFKVAYSNQAFEYWLILHFNDHQGGSMHRNEYCDKINDLIKRFEVTYDRHSKCISPNFFELLEERVNTAITRAKKIYNEHLSNNVTPAQAESSTTVFKLVEELLKHT